ncbi:glutamine-hydrolyzing carbamoyl-phosphate synthase small subunit [Candidatus Symbiobacter mobilis]|uniref:Carbamoyl phosphate synthase small chain n=1 Tax=Candidatus Symbiobacter mobilis CR TaxID=946483 RepID=U5N5S1_9BURK|nr:glutamine-hydrolyzing carbamoyl-phosphate synthase small subunit [Candidatus Symbiobacter mobilis]AGX86831.1 carbamoyl-phosphate synthase small subunit [Candidatus Symbiobacter mobilis CR]
MLASLGLGATAALLALADGTVFVGVSIGAEGATVGEVVFNTAMTGYQEILSDPSYCQQIVTLTYPHIGNVGVNPLDMESDRYHAAGLVIRDLPLLASNFRATQSLGDALRERGMVAIAGVDTRALTRRLRSEGAQNGCIVALPAGHAITPAVREDAIARARSAPAMAGCDLARVVTTPATYTWNQTEWRLDQPHAYGELEHPRFHVVAYDFGVKRNILRMLAQRGCRVTVVPATTPLGQALVLRPDGIFFSNGPGDPQPCTYAIDAAAGAMERGIPTFGICLGHQIMALACGAKTFKMKFGHHGANHPVRELATGRVSITSQNHGFAVDESTLPSTLRPTHVSLFDGTLQGLERTDVPALCFQGHPEASPGPHDVSHLFDRFIANMASAGVIQ